MRKLLLPLLLVLLALPVWAQASLTFTTYKGDPFLVKIDGRTVSRVASNFVRIANLRHGKHFVEFKIMGRYGVHSMGSKVYVTDGYEANYALHTAGRSGKAMLRLIDEVPLVRPRIPIPPAPRYPNRYEPRHPDYPRHDRYDECRNLLSSYELERLMDAMDNRSLESTKLSIARDALRNNSIMAEDLKRLLGQFDHESTRVEFAKYAYDYVCDRERFYYVYDTFKFDSSVRELEEYVSRRR